MTLYIPEQMIVVAKLIDHADVIHGTRVDSNITFPGFVLENSQHTTAAAAEKIYIRSNSSRAFIFFPRIRTCRPKDHDDGKDNYRPIVVPNNVTPPDLSCHPRSDS